MSDKQLVSLLFIATIPTPLFKFKFLKKSSIYIYTYVASLLKHYSFVVHVATANYPFHWVISYMFFTSIYVTVSTKTDHVRTKTEITFIAQEYSYTQ